jgi:opacity protein-like surface antigen
MKRHTPATLALAISLAAATTLMAQAQSSDVDAVTDTPAAQVHHAGAVDYINGGASANEREALRSVQPQFPLTVVFSGGIGELGVADQVRVLQGGQSVATIASAGPVLMLKLPPGQYTLEADFKQATQRRQVSVGAAPKTLHWASAAVSQN